MKNNKVSLTIGIPVYNSQEVIRETLDSIVNQVDDKLRGLCDLEILICDNCSIDNTQKIVEEDYIKKYPNINIRLHRNETNIGAPRNIGIVFDNAKGDYVWLCGDDVFYDKSLEYVTKIITKYDNLGVIIANSNIYDKSIKNLIIKREKSKINFIVCSNQKEFLQFSKESIYFLSSVILKKEYLDKIKGEIDYLSFYPQTDALLKISKTCGSAIINKPMIKERFDSWGSKVNSDHKIQVAFSMMEVLLKNIQTSNSKTTPQYNIAKQSIKHFIALHGKDIKNRAYVIDKVLKYGIIKKSSRTFYLILIFRLFSADLAFKPLLKRIMRKR